LKNDQIEKTPNIGVSIGTRVHFFSGFPQPRKQFQEEVVESVSSYEVPNAVPIDCASFLLFLLLTSSLHAQSLFTAQNDGLQFYTLGTFLGGAMGDCSKPGPIANPSQCVSAS
jgi:hypothetical protein